MGPKLDPVASDTKVPPRTTVVVIGGGIIGTSTALFLARKKIPVVLCEKGEIGGEQSSRNWGWVRKQGRDSREMPLIVESLRLWEGMNEMVGSETGFRRCGILYVSDTEAEMARRESWLEIARPYQLDTRVLSSDEVYDLVPGATRKFHGALYTASDGRAEPQKAAPAIASAAVRQGAHVFTNCAVRGVETKAGRIAGVVTERGPIRCESVLLAGGAWSRLFCGNMGVNFPQLKVLGCVARTEPIDGLPDYAVGAGNFAFRKRLDGGYTIAQRNGNLAPLVPDSFRLFFDFAPALIKQWSELRLRVGRRFLEEWRIPRHWSLDTPTPFETVRVLDPEPSDAVLNQGAANLIRNFPAFKGMKIAERWAGLVDVTPDAVPVISAVPGHPGFYLASGFSGHGFGLGPAAGRLAADLVAGDPPIVDPAPFRFERLVKETRSSAV